MFKEPQIAQKGPYEVEVEPGRYSWCSCGLSKDQPRCDNTHRGNSTLRSVKIEFTEKKTIWFCGCKQTENPPYCDGTHNKLQ
ncbi:MAG: CDGSH iron-sulfur domain-containing protein [Flavobacteriales bacterium]|nr:CDGSH iron-sulfur domain-containing protein [Flavobacteriales bacterium]